MMRTIILTIFFPAVVFSDIKAGTPQFQLFNEHKENIRKGNLCLDCHESSEIKELQHTSLWITEHKNVSVRKEGDCVKCHSVDFCGECHSYKQRLKPSLKNPEDTKSSYPHRGDWISTHFLESNYDEGNCYRCHTSKFCKDCHDKKIKIPGYNPHPANWLSGEVHAREARKNIGECASCHEAGADTRCIICHKTINPHPDNWSETRAGLKKNKDRPCIYCHAE